MGLISYLVLAMFLVLGVAHGQRGANIAAKFNLEDDSGGNQESDVTTTTYVNLNDRAERGSNLIQKLQNLGIKVSLETAPPTTTTTTTTTKSPEEIEKAKKIEEEKQDPKGIRGKFKGLFDDEEDSATTTETTTKTTTTTLKPVVGCNGNSACGISKCCFKEDPAMDGKCISPPHTIYQQCSDLCSCQGKMEGIDLVCVKKVTLSEDDGQKSTNQMSKECRQRELNELEMMKHVLQKIRGARGEPIMT